MVDGAGPAVAPPQNVPATPDAHPKPGRDPSRGRWAAIVAVVAVAAVLVFVAVDPGAVWPTHPSPASSSGVAASFASWRALAQQAANGSRPGTWLLVRADAGLYATAYGVDPATLLLPRQGPLCNQTAAAGLPSEVALPGLGNVSGGISFDWLYSFTNANGTQGMEVLVVDGTATLIGWLTGAQCSTSYGEAGAVPSGAIDSIAAAVAIGNEGWFQYISAHAVSNGVLTLLGNFSVPGKSAAGPVWSFEAVDCTPIGGGGSVASGPGYTAAVNGLTGASIVGGSSTVDCVLPL